MGESATLDDQLKNKGLVAEAKKLSPSNETLQLLEADLTSVEGNIDLALEMVDKVVSTSLLSLIIDLCISTCLR